LEDCKDHVYAGGKTDGSDRYIEPTILTNLDKSKAKVMQEEIFGPLLPVFRFSKLDEVISYINEGEKPLTMYIFARNSKVINRLQQVVPSGSIVTNDCLFQFANHFAPFGGVGFSGETKLIWEDGELSVEDNEYEYNKGLYLLSNEEFWSNMESNIEYAVEEEMEVDDFLEEYRAYVSEKDIQDLTIMFNETKKEYEERNTEVE
jgi:acyl-CoA reductase-like NAD-dependent aldehyde dehydrogenase